MAGNPDLSKTHSESQIYLSTRGGDEGVSGLSIGCCHGLLI